MERDLNMGGEIYRGDFEEISMGIDARPITGRERINEALQEAAEANSICDGRDSTTLQERRSLALCMHVQGAEVFYSFERGSLLYLQSVGNVSGNPL